MFSSQEISKFAEEKKMSAEIVLHGTSYRAGGTIIISKGNWKEFDTISMKKTGQAFDGTGYDGRGRNYEVYLFSNGGDWKLASPGEFYSVKEEDRMIVGNPDSKSGYGYLFIKTSAMNQVLGSIAELFGEIVI